MVKHNNMITWPQTPYSLSSSKVITLAEEFLLKEDVDTQEDTEDESDEVNRSCTVYFCLIRLILFAGRSCLVLNADE